MDFVIGCGILCGIVLLRMAMPGRERVAACPACRRELDITDPPDTTCPGCDAELPPPTPTPARPRLAIAGVALIAIGLAALGYQALPRTIQPTSTADLIADVSGDDGSAVAWAELSERAVRKELTQSDYRTLVPIVLDLRDTMDARRDADGSALILRAHEAGVMSADDYARYAEREFAPLELTARPRVAHHQRVPVWIGLRQAVTHRSRRRHDTAGLAFAFRHAQWEIDGQIVDGGTRDWTLLGNSSALPHDASALWVNPRPGSTDSHTPDVPPLAPGPHTVRLTTQFMLLHHRQALDTPLHTWEQSAEAEFEVLSPGASSVVLIDDPELAASLERDMQVMDCRATVSAGGSDGVIVSVTLHVPPCDVGLAFEMSLVSGDRRWLFRQSAYSNEGRVASFIVNPRDKMAAMSAELYAPDFDARTVNLELHPKPAAMMSAPDPTAVLGNPIVIKDVPVSWPRTQARN